MRTGNQLIIAALPCTALPSHLPGGELASSRRFLLLLPRRHQQTCNLEKLKFNEPKIARKRTHTDFLLSPCFVWLLLVVVDGGGGAEQNKTCPCQRAVVTHVVVVGFNDFSG